MKLFSYWRSLATYRVRIALNLKGIAPDEVIDVNLHQGKQREDGLSQAQSDDGAAGAGRRRRQCAVRVARHPGISRRDPSGAAAVAERAEGARARARPGADHRLRHPSADRAARARISAERIQGRRGRRDEMGPSLAQAALNALESNLAGSPHTGRFAQGDQITIADICLCGQAVGAAYFKFDLAPFPVFRRIVDAMNNRRVRARPSAQAAGRAGSVVGSAKAGPHGVWLSDRLRF